MVIATGNRVEAAIERYEVRIKALNGVGLDGRKVSDVEAGMALTFDDFFQYQQLQALAHATGKLTPDEAQTIYLALGGEGFHGDWPVGTRLAVKLVVTQLMGELLGIRPPGPSLHGTPRRYAR